MDHEKSFLAFPHQTLQGSIGSLSNRFIDDEKALLGLSEKGVRIKKTKKPWPPKRISQPQMIVNQNVSIVNKMSVLHVSIIKWKNIDELGKMSVL